MSSPTNHVAAVALLEPAASGPVREYLRALVGYLLQAKLVLVKSFGRLDVLDRDRGDGIAISQAAAFLVRGHVRSFPFDDRWWLGADVVGYRIHAIELHHTAIASGSTLAGFVAV